jgi:hypothetical protein
MMIFSPRFWQFYAKGVIWTALFFLPLLLLQNFLNSRDIVPPFISETIATLFALGTLVVDVICGYSQICLTQGMNYLEQTFFAYFVTILIFGFLIGLYFSWTWLPKKELPTTSQEKKDDYEY